MIRDMKMKVQATIQGDQLRVQGKKRDDLQEAVIVEVKALDFRVPLQFVNYRDELAIVGAAGLPRFPNPSHARRLQRPR